MTGTGAYVNASVYSGGGSLIEKGFVSWRDGMITGVGPMEGFDGRRGEAEDLHGGLVLPGLTDCHLHLVGYSLSLKRVELSRTSSVEEALDKIGRSAADLRPGEWLVGRGWDKQRLGLESFPHREMLDRVTGDRPAAMGSRDGHLLWLNTAGLAALEELMGGLEVEGGEVERGEDGRPTGILKERAAYVALMTIDRGDPDRVADAIREACLGLAGMGLVRIHTLESPSQARLVDHAAASGKVPIGLVRMVEVGEPDEVEEVETGGDISFIKVLADGALGSQTARMMEPYCGQPGNYGITSVPASKLERIAERALDAGFSLAVHAIGDRANMEVLDVYEALRGRRSEIPAVLRIEHVQVVRPEDVERFGRLGVVASMQPIHLLSDMDVVDRFWGERGRYTYIWKQIMDAGGAVAFGSDAPIESPDPVLGIHAAVTRSRPGPGNRAWYPEERITPGLAVDCYTRGAVRAGSPPDTGTLEPGRRADLTVLDRNIFAIPPEEIHTAGVVAALLSGERIA
jgi:hypothetical protein